MQTRTPRSHSKIVREDDDPPPRLKEASTPQPRSQPIIGVSKTRDLCIILPSLRATQFPGGGIDFR